MEGLSFSSYTLQVVFDPDTTGARTLLDIVEGLGYEATLEEDDADEGSNPAAAEKRYWLRKFCWSAVFSVPVFLLAMVRQEPNNSSWLLCMR